MSALAKRIIAPAAHLQKIYVHHSSGSLRSIGGTIAIGQDVPAFAKKIPIDPRGTNWIQIVREGDSNPEIHPDFRIKVYPRIPRSYYFVYSFTSPPRRHPNAHNFTNTSVTRGVLK